MEYLSAHFRQRGENPVSLLLQQYKCGQAPVLFGCICTGKWEYAGRAGGYMTKQLLQWFRKLNLKKISKHEREVIRLARKLDKMVHRIDSELADGTIAPEGEKVSFALIICLENDYLMICRGDQRIYLLNTAFGGVHIKRLCRQAQGQSMYMEHGVLQPDIGLLLTTETFWEYVTEKMVEEGLSVKEVVTQEQMERHLWEIAAEGERLGGKDMGAILLRTAER